MKLEYIEVSKDNIDLATIKQQEKNSRKSSYIHDLYMINKNEKYEKYYLVFTQEKCKDVRIFLNSKQIIEEKGKKYARNSYTSSYC